MVYVVDAASNPLQTANASASPAIVCGLIAHERTVFRVRALNYHGFSPAAISNNITATVTTPSQPVNVLQPSLVLNVTNCLEIGFSVMSTVIDSV